MQTSHAAAQIPSSSQKTAWQKLQDFLAERRRAGDPITDWESFEREAHALFAAAECEFMAEELARLDVDLPAVEIGGVTHRQVLRCEQTYYGTAGEIRVMRSLYSTRHGGERAVCPLELRAGIVEGLFTPLAAQQATWAVAHMTPGEAEEWFGRLGGMSPSKTTLDRLPKKLSERWEENREAWEQALRKQETIPKQAATAGVSLDGVLVPMRDDDAAEKPAKTDARSNKGDKATSGPADYKEVGCATLSFYDAEGERISTVQMARMPEEGKPTLKGWLADELDAALKARPDLRVHKIADAAKDNWTFLAGLPKSNPGRPTTSGVDFYHATEHLKAALNAAYGEGPTANAQYEKLRLILRDEEGGVEKVIRSLAYLRDQHPRRKKIATELNFFRKNRHRMKYAELRAQNLPIGSGVVEAACKTLAGQRLKRSGMRWAHEGGQAVLTFRALAKSGRFDRAWKFVAATYKQEVVLPDNVVSLVQRRNRR